MQIIKLSFFGKCFFFDINFAIIWLLCSNENYCGGENAINFSLPYNRMMLFGLNSESKFTLKVT